MSTEESDDDLSHLDSLIDADDDLKPIDTGSDENKRAPKSDEVPLDLPEDSPLSADDDEDFSDNASQPPDIQPFGAPPVEPVKKTDEDEDGMMRERLPTEIFKGDYVDLRKSDPALNKIVIGAGWEQRRLDHKTDADLSCFLLDKTDKTRENDDFIFYNNDSTLDGGIKFNGDSRTGAGEGDDEQITIDLNAVPYDILKIAFTITVYNPSLDEELHFGTLRDVYIRIAYADDLEREVARVCIDEELLPGKDMILPIVLVREGPQWFIDVPLRIEEGGLGDIAEEYGLVITERTG